MMRSICIVIRSTRVVATAWLKQSMVAKSSLRLIDEELAGDPQLRKRLQLYGTVVPVVACDVYCQLLGRKPTIEERRMATDGSILAAIIDNITDTEQVGASQILGLTQNEPSSQLQHLAKKFLLRLNESAHRHGVEWNHVAAKIIDEQNASKALINDDPWRHTYQKGGLSMLLARCFLQNPVSGAEKDMAMLYGALFQLLDDVFDVWEDTHNGEATVPVALADMFDTERFYLGKLAEFHDLVKKTTYTERGKRRFIQTSNFIFAWGMVALRQFKKVQGSNNFLDVKQLERKELICDMAKLHNNILIVKYTYLINARLTSMGTVAS